MSVSDTEYIRKSSARGPAGLPVSAVSPGDLRSGPPAAPGAVRARGRWLPRERPETALHRYEIAHEEDDDLRHARSASSGHEASMNSGGDQRVALCKDTAARCRIHVGFISRGDHRRMHRITPRTRGRLRRTTYPETIEFLNEFLPRRRIWGHLACPDSTAITRSSA